MERIRTTPLVTHQAMDTVIDAVRRWGNMMLPATDTLKAAARERFPLGAIPSAFADWLEAQAIPPSPEDLIKD